MDEDEEERCPICKGEGIIGTYEPVYPGEPHRAFIGEKPCDCQGDPDDRLDYPE